MQDRLIWRVVGCRWLLDSPLLLASWVTFAIGIVAILDVAAALHRAEAVRGEVASELARLAVEAAAIEVCANEAEQGQCAVGGFDIRYERRGPQLLLTARTSDNEVWHFACLSLSGAAPSCFSQRLVAVDPDVPLRVGEGSVLGNGTWPRLDPSIVAGAPRADGTTGFAADPALGLLHWDGGTEGPDFVFAGFGTSRCRAPAGGVIVVPGHLWVPPSSREYRCRLDRDVTVIVQGNLYLGASIGVEGPGRLVLVASSGPTSMAFADRDGNGRWSAGDLARGAPFQGRLEGGGNVYFGLPRAPRSVVIQASVIADGEVHLASETTLAGCLAVPHGLTELGPAALRLSGEALFNVQRERVPGFVTDGAPRPGLLQLLVGTSGDGLPVPGEGQQPLYLAASPR